jgi:hypothetical protein
MFGLTLTLALGALALTCASAEAQRIRIQESYSGEVEEFRAENPSQARPEQLPKFDPEKVEVPQSVWDEVKGWRTRMATSDPAVRNKVLAEISARGIDDPKGIVRTAVLRGVEDDQYVHDDPVFRRVIGMLFDRLDLRHLVSNPYSLRIELNNNLAALPAVPSWAPSAILNNSAPWEIDYSGDWWERNRDPGHDPAVVARGQFRAFLARRGKRIAPIVVEELTARLALPFSSAQTAEARKRDRDCAWLIEALAVTNVKPTPVATLERAIRERTGIVRLRALYLAGETKAEDETLADAVGKIAQGEAKAAAGTVDLSARLAASIALGKLPTKSAIDALLTLLDHDNEDIRKISQHGVSVLTEWKSAPSYRPDSTRERDVRRRQAGIEEWRAWWKERREEFVLPLVEKRRLGEELERIRKEREKAEAEGAAPEEGSTDEADPDAVDNGDDE